MRRCDADYVTVSSPAGYTIDPASAPSGSGLHASSSNLGRMRESDGPLTWQAVGPTTVPGRGLSVRETEIGIVGSSAHPGPSASVASFNDARKLAQQLVQNVLSCVHAVSTATVDQSSMLDTFGRAHGITAECTPRAKVQSIVMHILYGGCLDAPPNSGCHEVCDSFYGVRDATRAFIRSLVEICSSDAIPLDDVRLLCELVLLPVDGLDSMPDDHHR